MINIDFNKKNKNNRTRYSLDIVGHAGFNPGNDIVCSACSMLAETYFVSVLKNVEHISQAYRHPGDYKVMFETDADDNVADTIYSTIRNGFKMLADRYPDHVHLMGN